MCGMVQIKDPLLLIRKSSSYSGGSWFPLSLTSPLPCPTLYNRKHVLGASLNKVN